MGFSGLRAIVRDRNYSIHGVPANIAPPTGPSKNVTIIWLTPITLTQPGGEIRRADARRAFGVRTSEISALPRGSVVTAAEAPGEAAAEFLVDSMDHVEHGEYRVTVVPRG